MNQPEQQQLQNKPTFFQIIKEAWELVMCSRHFWKLFLLQLVLLKIVKSIFILLGIIDFFGSNNPMWLSIVGTMGNKSVNSTDIPFGALIRMFVLTCFEHFLSGGITNWMKISFILDSKLHQSIQATPQQQGEPQGNIRIGIILKKGFFEGFVFAIPKILFTIILIAIPTITLGASDYLKLFLSVSPIKWLLFTSFSIGFCCFLPIISFIINLSLYCYISNQTAPPLQHPEQPERQNNGLCEMVVSNMKKCLVSIKGNIFYVIRKEFFIMWINIILIQHNEFMFFLDSLFWVFQSFFDFIIMSHLLKNQNHQHSN